MSFHWADTQVAQPIYNSTFEYPTATSMVGELISRISLILLNWSIAETYLKFTQSVQWMWISLCRQKNIS